MNNLRNLEFKLLQCFVLVLPALAFGININEETIALSYIFVGILGLFLLLKLRIISIDSSTRLFLCLFLIASISSWYRLTQTTGFEYTNQSGYLYLKSIKQLVMLAVIIVHYIVLRNSLKSCTLNLLYKLIWFFIGVSFFVSLYSVYQYFGLRYDLPLTDILRNSYSYTIVRGKELSNWTGMTRARAFMPESSFWGAYLLIPIGLIFPFSFNNKSRMSARLLVFFCISGVFSFFSHGVVGIMFNQHHFFLNKDVETYLKILKDKDNHCSDSINMDIAYFG